MPLSRRQIEIGTVRRISPDDVRWLEIERTEGWRKIPEQKRRNG
jgi:hypothetical protein